MSERAHHVINETQHTFHNFIDLNNFSKNALINMDNMLKSTVQKCQRSSRSNQYGFEQLATICDGVCMNLFITCSTYHGVSLFTECFPIMGEKKRKGQGIIQV
jgi:hypothetical protein